MLLSPQLGLAAGLRSGDSLPCLADGMESLGGPTEAHLDRYHGLLVVLMAPLTDGCFSHMLYGHTLQPAAISRVRTCQQPSPLEREVGMIYEAYLVDARLAAPVLGFGVDSV